MSSEGYIGFDAFEEIMIQRYAAQDPMDEIRKAFDAWLAQVAGVWRLEEPGKTQGRHIHVLHVVPYVLCFFKVGLIV